MRRALLCIALLAGLTLAGTASAQALVYLVRHGEKLDDSRDSVLSAAGMARSERLAQLLADARIDAIFTSEYQRTQQLAAPLAQRLGLKPQVLPARDMATLLEQLRGLGPTQRALIVGHSNTVPALLKALGHDELVTIAEHEFDNLFVLMPRPAQTPLVTRLHY